MGKMLRLTLLCLLVPLAGACAERTLVALAPDPDGKVGSISVSNEAGSVAIDAPYQATTVGAKKRPAAPEELGKKTLDRIFADALSIQPKQPLHFLLYFDENAVLTPESTKMLPEIFAAIRERDSEYISVIGHTDTLGTKEYNTELSYNRAMAIRELLIREGVESDYIHTTSHGEENPLIPTADDVYEPRNRRVEVVVR